MKDNMSVFDFTTMVMAYAVVLPMALVCAGCFVWRFMCDIGVLASITLIVAVIIAITVVVYYKETKKGE